MSELRNVDSVANANQGQFKPSVAPTGPLREDGHQLGTKVSPADFKPEFHAETYPPGTAPASSSHQPNPTSTVPGQAMNDLTNRSHGKEQVVTTAESTLRGATSQDVHRGLGHPGSGQTSTEVRHDGEHHRKRQSHGLETVGAHREDKFERVLPDQRGLEKEQNVSGQRGNKGERAAEDMEPASA